MTVKDLLLGAASGTVLELRLPTDDAIHGKQITIDVIGDEKFFDIINRVIIFFDAVSKDHLHVYL